MSDEKRRAKHTPGPWHTQADFPWAFSSANDVPIGECFGKVRAVANAAFIVTACNAHDDLLAALEDMLLLSKRMDNGGVPESEASQIEDRARAAIAKATIGAAVKKG